MKTRFIIILLFVYATSVNAKSVLIMGMTQASETMLMYGLILLVLAMLYGIDKFIIWFRHYLKHRKEAHTTLTHE